jgi:transcriptional regulator with XRE-family HTH domain
MKDYRKEDHHEYVSKSFKSMQKQTAPFTGLCCKLLAMNRATITQIELGKIGVTAEELAKFCFLFGISADVLLFDVKLEYQRLISPEVY